MNRETQNEKRALNIVWTAAGDYSLKPMFLAYCRDGTPDIYLNTVIGLVCKWYDQNMIDGFFDSLGTGQRELYEGIFWLGLEHAAYEKEVQVRPALEELRSEYASVNLREGRDLTSNSLLDLLQYGRFCEILGKKAELPGRWQTLLTQLSYSSSMTSRQMIERTKAIYQTYFQYTPRSHKKREAGHFLQRVLPAFFSLGKVHSGFVRVGASADKEAPLAAPAGGFLKHMGYLFEFFRAKDYSSARDYVEACFGTDIHSPRIAKQIEQDLCTGNHIGLRLLFTRGDLPPLSRVSGREQKECLSFRREVLSQREKNIHYYKEHLALHQNSVRRLCEKLSRALEAAGYSEDIFTRSGYVRPALVWRALFLDDNRIFTRKGENPVPGFSVDILLDASSSRKRSQESIAAQAYILTESLTRLHIPVQIYSYCSIRGYTVLHLYRTYREADRNSEVFRYAAAGNNRDGLALRASRYMMEDSPCEKKLLVVLSDASPNDDLPARDGSFYRNREYTDSVGIEDAAKEVWNLKKQGIQVLGVFMGIEKDISAARQIFGKDVVKIQDINHFAEYVGNMMIKILLS